MTRRKWRIKRTMVVPAQWQGSVEHFYHFFLGYFVPLVLWQERTEASAFTVRDCGPMNPWFDLLRPGTDLDFMPAGVMLERYLSHRQERQVLHDWDNPTRFHRASLQLVAATVRERVGAPIRSAHRDGRRITLLDRRTTPDFYLDPSAEVHGSGADWRSMPNTASIAEALAVYGTVTILDTADMTPADQVRALADSDVLVAQHGAGLANMVWLPAGAAVIEIQPPLPPIIDTIFANLASARSLDHLLVPQDDEHAPGNVSAIVTGLERLLAKPGTFVPEMPGRLPTRIWRQLPRRH